MPSKRKKRKPILLITVASLAAVAILYLEFFADPIIDPPRVLSDGSVQIQFLTARTPFLRRPVFKLAAIDCLFGGGNRYELVGREVRLDEFLPGTPESVKGPASLLISTHNGVRQGGPELFDALWRRRDGFMRLSEEWRRAGRTPNQSVEQVLREIARRIGDQTQSETLHNCTHTLGKMD